MEGLGRLPGHLAADACDLNEFSPPPSGGLGLGQSLGFLCVAVREGCGRLAADDQGAQKIVLPTILFLAPLLLQFRCDSLETEA